MTRGAVRDSTTHEALLPSALREFQTELAGRLVLLDEPGREVKSLREKYGFTQDFLARLVELRRESLSRIESNSVGLSIEFVRAFTRVITMARGVREHLAYAEARGNVPDERSFEMLAMHLRLDPAVKEEIVLASMVSYEKKRRDALRGLPGVRKSI